MKKFLLSIGLIVAASFVMAQCYPIMPSVLKVKLVDGVHSNGGDDIWICAGLTFEVSGQGNNVYIEKNCNITISGNDNNIYFIKRPGTIDVIGSNNTTAYEKNVNYSDVSGNFSDECDTIFVDYTDAPTTGGCDIYAGIDNKSTSSQIKMYPNPVKDVLHIENSGNVSLSSYQVYGVNGNIVLSGQFDNSNKIDVSALGSGLYVFRIWTSGGEISERITIE